MGLRPGGGVVVERPAREVVQGDVLLLAEGRRVAMVGDTLHTDTLGGAAAGCGTVLVTHHGLFKGHDVAPYISRSGIVPDIIVKTT